MLIRIRLIVIFQLLFCEMLLTLIVHKWSEQVEEDDQHNRKFPGKDDLDTPIEVTYASSLVSKVSTISLNSRSCMKLRCRAGRICVVVGPPSSSKKKCICNNPDNCPKMSHRHYHHHHHLDVHHRNDTKICGSDGRTYDSHCELHSRACMSKTHVSVMNSLDFCIRAEKFSRVSREGSGNKGKIWKIDENLNPNIAWKSRDNTKATEIIARLGTTHKLRCISSGDGSDTNQYEDGENPTDKTHVNRYEDGKIPPEETHRNRYSDGKGSKETHHQQTRGRETVHKTHGEGDNTVTKTYNNTPLINELEEKFVWTKDGAILNGWSNNSLLNLIDEYLIFREISYHHVGFYTCLYVFNVSNKPLSEEMHILAKYKVTVYSPPLVRLYPSTQFHVPGDTIRLHCHVTSNPVPSISWFINEEPLDVSMPKYVLTNGNRTLEVEGASHIVDTGAYKCVAENGMESSQDISTVFIEEVNLPRYSKGVRQDEVFVLLTGGGVEIVDPIRCKRHPIRLLLSNLSSPPLISEHVADGEFISIDYLQRSLRWDSAAVTGSRFIYATLKKRKSIVRIDANPQQSIHDDKLNMPLKEIYFSNCIPVNSKYIPWLDQVWSECWSHGNDDDGDDDDKALTSFMIIEKASKEGPRVSFLNFGDLTAIKASFLPPEDDFDTRWESGYLLIIDHSGRHVYELNLSRRQIVRKLSLDFSSHQCLPDALHFIIFGGKILIECSETKEQHDNRAPPATATTATTTATTTKKYKYFILDSSTHTMEGRQILSSAGYKLSPDSKLLSGTSDDMTSLIVYQVSTEGILKELMNTAVMDLMMSENVFFIGSATGGYDVVVRCHDSHDILLFNVKEKRVDILSGKINKDETKSFDINSKHRLMSSGFLGNYIMTSSRETGIRVIDVKGNSEKCHWMDSEPDLILGVKPIHL